MHETLGQMLTRTSQAHHFREKFLKESFTRHTTLREILEDPERTLNIISTLNGIGPLSLSRLRQIIARQLSILYPQDWENAYNTVRSGSLPENAVEQNLVHFISTWKISMETIQAACKYYSLCEIKAEDIKEKLEAHQPYIYIPPTLIDHLKTPAVFKAETGKSLNSHGVPKKLRSIFPIRCKNRPQDEEFNGLTMLNICVLEDLLQGSGVYKNISAKNRKKQMQVLVAEAEKFSNHPIYVANTIQNDLSPGFVIGDGPLLKYCLGGILEVTSPDLVELFRIKAEEVAKSSPTLSEWLIDNVASGELLIT